MRDECTLESHTEDQMAFVSESHLVPESPPLSLPLSLSPFLLSSLIPDPSVQLSMDIRRTILPPRVSFPLSPDEFSTILAEI